MRGLGTSMLAITAGALLLGGCEDSQRRPDPVIVNPPAPPVATPAPTPSPTPTPPPMQTSFNVSQCLAQEVAPGASVASLVVPDLVSIDLNGPSGFPNGRRLPDPVVDVTLAVIFLDLRRHPASTFASIPLNPGSNDRPFRAEFPYLSPPQGNPPISTGAATNYNFRNDAESSYVLVERAAFPAVATALVSGPQRVPYNESNPAEDAAGRWVPELTSGLETLFRAFADDLQGLNLQICATPT